MRKLTLIAIAATLALYAATIALGLRLHSGSLSSLATLGLFSPVAHLPAWQPPSLTDLPPSRRETIALGQRLFDETPIYLAANTPSRIACASCHLQSGIAPLSPPVVGSAQAYPQFSKRSGRTVTLQDRIQECMTRSENGLPLAPEGSQMHALTAYINWLSEPHPTQQPFRGRGIEHLPGLTPDPAHGASLYASQCAGCHGTHGEGTRRPFPPLWGPESFNDGAGMNTLPKLSAFIHQNMPQNRKGILSPQDATDLAAYIRNQPRPAYNHAYDHF